MIITVAGGPDLSIEHAERFSPVVARRRAPGVERCCAGRFASAGLAHAITATGLLVIERLRGQLPRPRELMDSVMDKDPSALPDSIFSVASPLVRAGINRKYGAPGETRTPNLLIRSCSNPRTGAYGERESAG
jgi:hypothetical protein